MTKLGPVLFLVGAAAACGPQDWFFDSEAGINSGEAGPLRDAESPDDGSSIVQASTDARPDASDERDDPQCAVASDCPADTPVCRLPDGECGRCDHDSECSGAPSGSACDVSSGRCVGCTGDVQCPSATPRCYPATQTCVRCLSTSDCGRESFCDLTTHVCMSTI